MTRTVKLLQELHAVGVAVRPCADWNKEEWDNYVLHQFNIHCMPYCSESARETAAIVYALRKSRNQVWNTPYRRR